MKTRGILIILIFVALWCSPAYSFEACQTDGGLDIKWNTPNVTYYINTSGGPSNNLEALQTSMQTWNDVSSSNFNFIYGGTTTSTAHGSNNGTNIVTFARMYQNGILAVNNFWYNPATGYIIDSDIRFNLDYTWNTTGATSVFDVQNVGTHEYGHSLCLMDLYTSGDIDKTMYYSAGYGETKKRTLHQDDIDGITYLYESTVCTVNMPSNITVPAVDPDGNFIVSWGASSTAGVTYELEEATDSSFTLNLRTAYEGPDTNASISGGVEGATYYYRVRAVKSGCISSGWLTANNGCFVSTDTTAPASTITSPFNNELIMAPSYLISGESSDIGSRVTKVEVSINGGAWQPATGTTSWNYNWTIPADGIYTIRSRATDAANNVEIPAQAIQVSAYKRQMTSVTVSGRQIRVKGAAFTVKGVVYSPTPIGEDPETAPPHGDYFTSDYSSIYNRDLPLIRQMNANTIRLWTWDNGADHRDFLDKAYNNGTTPVYVIAGFWLNAGRDIDPNSPTNEREDIKSEFRQMVAAHKNHPAILMWAIGNELNGSEMYGSEPDNLFTLINEMAAEAHAEEGAGYHPVTTPLFDSNLKNTIAAYNSTVPNLDIWGANVYRGNTFSTLFTDYSSVSTKPLVILEYGIDAYDIRYSAEYEMLGTAYQADYAKNLWNQIKTNSATCIGGTIMEYSDEWWRGKQSSDPNCTEMDPAVHGTCGYTTTTHPDRYANDEWWGLMRTEDNGANPDIMEPRVAYYTLKNLWTTSTTPTITVTSPNGGENWTAGTTKTIRWIYTGNPGTYVKIELLKNGVLSRTITTSVSKGASGSGSYNWAIPATQAPGTVYKIRVTSTTNSAYKDMSDDNFTISAPPPPSITVTAPNGGEIWTKGTTKTIRWTYTGNPGTYVKIELLKAGSLNRTIISSVSKGASGSGSYNWLIPTTQATGTDYTIRVTSTTNSTYKDTSNSIFTIQ